MPLTEAMAEDEGHINGLVQNCSISVANAMEILQFCSKPSTYRISWGQWVDTFETWTKWRTFCKCIFFKNFFAFWIKFHKYIPECLNDCWSALVHVMAWCQMATSHYMNQCGQKHKTPYGVTRPHWVKRTQLDSVFNTPLSNDSDKCKYWHSSSFTIHGAINKKWLL